MPKRILRPQFEPIEDFVYIFVSSDQDEFYDIRPKLKRDIQKYSLKFNQLFHVKLVEHSRSIVIDKDIQKSLQKCEILILLIGTEQSDYTEKEFIIAWNAGIPTLVYLYLDRGDIDPTIPTYKFLKQVVEPKVRIRGLHAPYRTYDSLRSDIFADLAYEVTELIHQSVEVRKVNATYG